MTSCYGQGAYGPLEHHTTQNAEFDSEINKYLDFTVPTITSDSLNEDYDKYTILDAREKEEYDVSHLPKALNIGYDNVDWSVLDNVDKSKPVLLYCSIGYRSEKMAEKLNKKGYKVYNLYGSIFDWANKSLKLVDNSNQQTHQIHGYNKSWSQWINNKELEVVY